MKMIAIDLSGPILVANKTQLATDMLRRRGQPLTERRQKNIKLMDQHTNLSAARDNFLDLSIGISCGVMQSPEEIDKYLQAINKQAARAGRPGVTLQEFQKLVR